jgi:hypothetical protein
MSAKTIKIFTNASTTVQINCEKKPLTFYGYKQREIKKKIVISEADRVRCRAWNLSKVIGL